MRTVMGKLHSSWIRMRDETCPQPARCPRWHPGAGPALGSHITGVPGRQSLPFRKTALGKAASVRCGS